MLAISVIVVVVVVAFIVIFSVVVVFVAVVIIVIFILYDSTISDNVTKILKISFLTLALEVLLSCELTSVRRCSLPQSQG